MLSLSQRLVSYFANAYTPDARLEINIGDFVGAIKGGRWADEIAHIRAATDTEQRAKLKGNLPAVTVSGTFNERRSAANLIEHSGLIALDIDHVPDPDLLKGTLGADPYIYAAFVSASGQGLCVIVHVDPEASHTETWLALDAYFKTEYDISTDPACKDVSRLRFASYDPYPWINDEAEIFRAPKRRRPEPIRGERTILATADDFRFVADQIIAERLDITESYEVWRDLGFAIADGLGEAGREIFHDISQFHPSYSKDDADRQYTRCLRGKGSGITKSTFFHAAKRAGLSIVSPVTRRITEAARAAKGENRPAQSAVDQLASEGIPAEVSRPVVDDVFANEVVEDGSTQAGSVAMMVAKYGQFRYNEITRKIEVDGEPLDDRAFNDLFIFLHKNIPRKPPSAEFLRSLVNSSFSEPYNPVRAFCEAVPIKYNRKKPHAIAELAASLALQDQTPEWGLKALTLWMVSFAEALERGEANQYMLILLGRQQGTGKTTFFRKLLPPALTGYYAETAISGTKEEALLTTEKVLLLVDEMAGLNKADWDSVKRMLTAKTVTERPAYGREVATFPRLASWAGTSNDRQLLRDTTGNRRFLVLDVEGIDRDRYNGIDKNELFGEAIWLARHGYTGNLKVSEYNEISAAADAFRQTSLEEDLVYRFFMPPSAHHPGRVETLSSSEIVEYMMNKTNHAHRINNVTLGKVLVAMGFERRHVALGMENGRRTTKRGYTVQYREAENGIF